MSDRKTMIAGPMQSEFPCISLHGVPLVIIADLGEPHALSFSRRNAVGLFDAAVPSVEADAGCMILLLPAPIADQLRAAQKQVTRQKAAGIGNGMIDGENLPPGTLSH